MRSLSWRLTLRVIAVLSWIVSILWLIIEPGYEPLLALLSGTAVFLGSFAVSDAPTLSGAARPKQVRSFPERLGRSFIRLFNRVWKQWRYLVIVVLLLIVIGTALYWATVLVIFLGAVVFLFLTIVGILIELPPEWQKWAGIAGIIGFLLLIFGIVLTVVPSVIPNTPVSETVSPTDTPGPEPTETPAPEPTNTLMPTMTQTCTPTPLPPTDTPTPVPPTDTPTPVTPTEMPTSEAVPTYTLMPTPFPTAPQPRGPITLTIYLRDTLTKTGFVALNDNQEGRMIYEKGKCVYGEAAVQIGDIVYHFDKPEVGLGEPEQLPNPWQVSFEFGKALLDHVVNEPRCAENGADFNPKKAQFWVGRLNHYSVIGEDNPYSLTMTLYGKDNKGNEVRKSIQVFFTVADAPESPGRDDFWRP